MLLINSPVVLPLPAGSTYKVERMLENNVPALLESVQSAIGHQGTVDALKIILPAFSDQIVLNRVEIKEPAEQVVFKLKGRLPEGKVLSAEEIAAIGYEFWHVTITPGKNICQACEKARHHAELHGKDGGHVVCRAHRAVNLVRQYFDETRNPGSILEDIIILPVPGEILEREIAGWTIVQAWRGFSHDQSAAFPARVAKFESGEYIDRQLAVVSCTGSKTFREFVITRDPALAGQVALFVAAHEPAYTNACIAIDTCTYGKAEAPDALPGYEGRKDCDSCEGREPLLAIANGGKVQVENESFPLDAFKYKGTRSSADLSRRVLEYAIDGVATSNTARFILDGGVISKA